MLNSMNCRWRKKEIRVTNCIHSKNERQKFQKLTENKTDDYYPKYEQGKDSKEYAKEIMKLHMRAKNTFSDTQS